MLRTDQNTTLRRWPQVGVEPALPVDDRGTSSYFTRILRLSFLSPDIVKAILSGRQPAELSAKRLSLCHTLPSAWPEQMSMLGVA